jgi:hypothetical protein
VFCDGVQHSLRFFLDHLNCVKVGLSVLPSIMETEKSRVGGVRQSCCFWSKIPWWKRKFETVRCRDATASLFSTKVRGKVFAHFHAVTIKRHSSLQNWLFGLSRQILCEQSSWCEWKWWACSWLVLTCLTIFRSQWVWTCHSNTRIWLMLSSLNACPIMAICPYWNFISMLHFFHACYMLYPSHSPWFGHKVIFGTEYKLWSCFLSSCVKNFIFNICLS